MIRVAVYDDSQTRCESLRAFIGLTPGLEWVGGFAGCDQVLKDMETCRPDLVLMDIEMPGVNGLEGVKLIKRAYPEIKVIMQTAFDDDEKIFEALKNGAEGYILKTATVTQIAQSIDEVINGGAAMTPSIALKVMRYFSQRNTTAESYELTPREMEVLKYLAEGLPYKMIADKISVSYFTVNNHVKKIYKKLHVNSLAEAVALAHKNRMV